MKYSICILSALVAATVALAAEPVQVNFNLVQVNQYPGQKQLTDSIATPGKRLVIDMGQPDQALQYFAATSSIPIRVRSDREYQANIANDAMVLTWETSRILYGPARLDSFLVSSSRIGCPGTEVGPSVAVAFSNGREWSYPPIRFGPLTELTVCPLGKGYQLEVNGRGDLPPLVRVLGSGALYGKR